ncbi:MAG TPA: PilN domain-containing protein [Pirellulaceae bacterium]|jgi:hypothetical protein
MHVNLLPQPFLRRLALRRQAWRWGAVVVSTAIVSGGFIAAQYSALAASRRAQSASAIRSKDLHALKADTERLLAEGKTIESAIASIQKAQPEDRTLTLLGIASTSAKKLNGKVHLKNIATQIAPVATVQQAAAPVPGAPGMKSAAPGSTVQTPNDFSLDGTAEDAAAISNFIEALRETGVFAKVDLTATNEASGSTGAQRHFRIDCKF